MTSDMVLIRRSFQVPEQQQKKIKVSVFSQRKKPPNTQENSKYVVSMLRKFVEEVVDERH